MGVFNKLFLKDGNYKRVPTLRRFEKDDDWNRRDIVKEGESLYQQRRHLEYEINSLVDELKREFFIIQDTRGIYQDMDMTLDMSIDVDFYLNEYGDLFKTKDDVIETFKKSYSMFIDQLINYSNKKLYLDIKLVKKTWYKNQNRLSARVRLNGESTRDSAKLCFDGKFNHQKNNPDSYSDEDIIKYCLGDKYYEAYVYIMDELPKVSVYDVGECLSDRTDIMKRVDLLTEKLISVIGDCVSHEKYFLKQINNLYEVHNRFYDNYFLKNL